MSRWVWVGFLKGRYINLPNLLLWCSGVGPACCQWDTVFFRLTRSRCLNRNDRLVFGAHCFISSCLLYSCMTLFRRRCRPDRKIYAFDITDAALNYCTWRWKHVPHQQPARLSERHLPLGQTMREEFLSAAEAFDGDPEGRRHKWVMTADKRNKIRYRLPV